MTTEKKINMEPVPVPPMYISLCETVFDIAYRAGFFAATGRTDVELDRELFHFVMGSAVEFENEFQNGEEKSDDAYLDAVERFTDKLIAEFYELISQEGVEEDVR